MSRRPPPDAPDVADVIETQGDFLWATLHRMGVREPDLPDVMQEVLIVLHRRLASYEPALPLRPWLFGVCLRVVLAWRRRAWFRRERPVAEVPETATPAADPEQAAVRAQEQRRLHTLLATLDPDKRAVFVMFELEQLTCAEIAEVVGVPVGTVWSRLHLARKQFAEACAHEKVRTPKGGPS